MSAMRATASVTAGALAAAHLVPSVAAIGPLRRRALPWLGGVGDPGHVALTFDDGPDSESTPAVLAALATAGARATFFVLGAQLAAHPDVGRRIADAGHEVAAHGWSHRPHLLRNPVTLAAELRRTVDCIESVTRRRPRFWRPPHGIPTGASCLAARRLGLRTVLWTADGRDWSADATGESVLERIESTLTGGGVVLLHDCDVTSAPGAWRSAVAAVPLIAGSCRDRGLRIGPVGEHGLPVRGRGGAHAAR